MATAYARHCAHVRGGLGACTAKVRPNDVVERSSQPHPRYENRFVDVCVVA